MPSSNPYFIRHQMGDSPGNNGGTFSACPDIIFSTTGAPNWTPQSINPNNLLTQASYNTDYGSTIQVSKAGNVNNFVYLRALNTAPQTTVPARLWMMYTQSDLALWPQNWRSDSIKVGNQEGARNWQDGTSLISGGPGPYIVTEQPFLWSPTPPDQGQHYCVISMVEPFPNADPPGTLSDPPFAPPSSIGYLGSFDQLVKFVLGNDWFGWRNTIDVSSLGATWQQTVPITGPEKEGQVYVGFGCTNMPTDGYVSAYMAGPDAENSLNVPKSPILIPNMNMTQEVRMPAGFKTSMVITYWQGNTVPPLGSQVAPVLTLPATAVERIMQGTPIKRAPSHFQVLDKRSGDFQGWKRQYIFGSTPMAWQTPPPTLRGVVGMPQQLDAVLGRFKDPNATWQRTYPIAAGVEGGRMYVGFACHDMPSDGVIGMEITGPTPNDHVAYPPTPITPNETRTIALDWPVGGEGTLTLSYWRGPTPVPVDGTVEPVILVAADPIVAQNPDEAPTWIKDVNLAGPSESASVYIGLVCQQMPTDGFIAFSVFSSVPVNGVNPPPLIQIAKTPIVTPNMSLMVETQLPPDFKGSMSILYWQGQTEPSAGALIAPEIMMAGGGDTVQLGSIEVTR